MSTAFIVLLCVVLLAIVVLQIGKVSELVSKIRGEEQMRRENTKWTAYGMLVFLVVFLGGTVISAYAYKNYMLGYGPLTSASEHGPSIQNLFDITLFFTGVVFVLTHIALFWFAYRYREQEGQRAEFFAHDTKLEIIWTAVPAVVMVLLVVGGLSVWNKVMADIKPGEEYMEIEATGLQFQWIIRYPGADGKLGTRDFKQITGTNPLGQVWTDRKNLDDFHPDEIVLPVGKKVRVRIIARDVLHNFYLPHFQVKMDAIPGLPTYWVFTPTKTTDEYRLQLSKYPEYQIPADPEAPNGPKMWQTFNYELACAELCGKGHYSMRRLVRIVSQEDYNAWLVGQKSFYDQNVKGSADDPNMGATTATSVEAQQVEFANAVEKALEVTDKKAKTLSLSHVQFETNSAKLTADSKYELDNLVSAMNKYPKLTVEVAGHTDNVGDAKKNLTLSAQRAKSVVAYLISKGVATARMSPKGYGDTLPKADNATDEGKATNRRTEFTILTQ